MRLLALFLMLIAATPAAPQTSVPVTTPQAGNVHADIETLVRILENDAARKRLISELRAHAGELDKSISVVSPPELTVVQRVASYARRAVEGAAAMVATAIGLGQHAVSILSGATAIDLRHIWTSMESVLAVVAVTFAGHFILRLGFRHVQKTFAASAARSGTLRRIGIVGLSVGTDIFTVLAAWAIGYIPVLYMGWNGLAGNSQALFLGAFLFIELAKVAARLVFAPRWPELRLVRIDDTTAAYWYFWLSRLVGIIGYVFLFAAPLLEASVSRGAAESLRVFVLFCALAMAWVIILQNRDPVRARLVRYTEGAREEPLGRALAGAAMLWHFGAIGYVTLVFLLWLTNREAALPFVLLATVESILAAAVGLVLTIGVVHLAKGGMRLPDDVRARLPLLEQRLNAFVPNVLRVIRGMIMVGVVLALAQIWRIADFIGWISSEFGQKVATSITAALFVLLAGGLVHLAVQSWVEYRLDPPYGRKPSARERTLLALFRNAFSIALGVIVLLLVLAELGVNIAPLLAGAGIFGLAVGFGSQKLVQDVINGVFIQFENAMNEGDVVTVGGITGTVERLTIRSVSLRTVDGAYHLIPFSAVDSISNFMKNFSYHVAAIGVNYRESISEVKQAMRDAFERLKAAESGEGIMGDLEMQGVAEFGNSAVVVRARIKTKPGRQWALGRAYNEIVKEVFDERGIEITFPHATLALPQGAGLKPLAKKSPADSRRSRRTAPAAPANTRTPRRPRKAAQATPADNEQEILREAQA